MFCSFGTSPKIMRLFCKGRVIEKDDRRFEALRTRMSKANGSDVELVGGRAIIWLDVYKAQTSCGFGVPILARSHSQDDTSENASVGGAEPGQMFVNRDTMDFWATKMAEKNALSGYQKNANARSLDGLPGLRSARRARGQWVLGDEVMAWVVRVGQQWEALLVGGLVGILVVAALHVVGLLDVDYGSNAYRR